MKQGAQHQSISQLRSSVVDGDAQPGIFTYGEFLPHVDQPISLGEGNTPLISLPRLGAALGVGRLFAKLEGCNPTGSYKDRIAAVTISLAIQEGRRGWVSTSSGNAGAALAAYGARAGLPGYLFVVPNIPREKLIPALALGVSLFKVRGVGDGAQSESEDGLFEAVRRVAKANDLFLGVTAHRFNPEGMRGADTIGLELCEVEARAIYVPTGGGGLAVAVRRGLKEVGSDRPIVVTQPEGCAPIARCVEGEIPIPSIDESRTKISALQLPSPPDGDWAVRTVQESQGWGTICSDQEILLAQRQLAVTEGLFVEPAAATAIAALKRDRELGRITTNDSVVVMMTGSGLKDLAAAEQSLEPPTLIEVDQVEGVVSDALVRLDHEIVESRLSCDP